MITFRELLNKVKKGETPRIIYDNIVYSYRNGEYIDRFNEPLKMNSNLHDAASKKVIEVIE